MNEKNRKYLDKIMKLYYNVSNTNNMKNDNEFNYIIHSNVMGLIVQNICNNITLEEPSTPYILGENSQINNTHDKIFRTILSDKEEAAKFITKHLNLKKAILPKDLEIYNSSFITNNFQNQEADIVYKIKKTNIFILIEHQTKIDKIMPFRILSYQVEIIRKNIEWSKINRQDYKLPLVIPIVLYTGKRKWNAKMRVSEIQNKLEDIEIEPGSYKLVDINTFNKKELLEDNLFTSKMMLLEKASSKESLENYLEEIIQKIQEKNKKVMIQIIDVILKQEIGREKSEKLIKILKGGDENMLACLEMLEKEEKRKARQAKLNEIRAKKEGMEIGEKNGEKRGLILGLKQGATQVARKLLSKNFSIDEIVDITGLSKKEIEKLIKA